MSRGLTPLQQLQSLREHRARPVRETSIMGTIAQTADEARKTHRKLGRLGELWESLVPSTLASHTRLNGLRRGVLSITVDSSAASFELDRLLRQGLTKELQQRFNGSLVRVKATIGQIDPDDGNKRADEKTVQPRKPRRK